MTDLERCELARTKLLYALTERNAELTTAERRIEELEGNEQARAKLLKALTERNQELENRVVELEELLVSCPAIGRLCAEVFLLEGQEPTLLGLNEKED